MFISGQGPSKCHSNIIHYFCCWRDGDVCYKHDVEVIRKNISKVYQHIIAWFEAYLYNIGLMNELIVRLTRQIWGIWKLRSAYSPETPNLGQNRWCFVPCDLEIWWMTLENNRAPLLCCFKLCATFHSHRWIQTGVAVRKRPIWVKFNDF